MKTICCILLIALASADPTQPHLAQAWQAESTGDGVKGQTGLESYLYEEEKTPGGLRAHVWDYGASCKKIELDTTDGINKDYPWGSYYVNCDGVDCCYSSGLGDDDVGVEDMVGLPVRPDVKMWDIHANTMHHRVKFEGMKDTTELNGKAVSQAEVWSEKDKIFGVTANYTYFITRSGADIITHRIDFVADKVEPGSILYGNFQVQKNITQFRETFKPPPQCLRPNTLACDGNKIRAWNNRYFRHSQLQG